MERPKCEERVAQNLTCEIVLWQMSGTPYAEIVESRTYVVTFGLRYKAITLNKFVGQ